MSIKINIISGRKRALESLLKEVADFIGSAANDRISAALEIDMNSKEKKTC